MRNLAIVVMLATLLMGCSYNANTLHAESISNSNLRFEKNRPIVSAMLADSTSIELEFDSGCANGYANIDSATLERIPKLNQTPPTKSLCKSMGAISHTNTL